MFFGQLLSPSIICQTSCLKQLKTYYLLPYFGQISVSPDRKELLQRVKCIRKKSSLITNRRKRDKEFKKWFEFTVLEWNNISSTLWTSFTNHMQWHFSRIGNRLLAKYLKISKPRNCLYMNRSQNIHRNCTARIVFNLKKELLSLDFNPQTPSPSNYWNILLKLTVASKSGN